MNADQILIRSYRLINIYNSMQKKSHTYSCGLVLYPAQSHTVAIIGESEGISQSEIAAEYMITKGAVSQIVSFLEQKGLIIRKPSFKGGRTAGLFLTPLGKEIFREHRQLHGTMIDEISQLAEGLSPDAIDVLSRITDVIERNIRDMNQSK